MSELDLPINQWVYPFAAERRFLPHNLTKIWVEKTPTKILGCPISFNEISGAIELYAQGLHEGSGMKTETPLGKADMVVGYAKSGFVVARKLPLFLMLSFTIKDLYELHLLNDFQATINLGESRYLMPCLSTEEFPDIVKGLLKTDGSANLSSDQIFRENGDTTNVRLPHSLNLVKRLGLMISSKPHDFGRE